MKGEDQERLPCWGAPCWGGVEVCAVQPGDSYKARGTSVHGGMMRGVLPGEVWGAQSAAWGISSKKLGDRSLPWEWGHGLLGVEILTAWQGLTYLVLEHPVLFSPWQN